MICLEARCSGCGEIFNPADENDLEHVAKDGGSTPCGGMGELTGAVLERPNRTISDEQVARVIARYDELVRGNTSDAYDAVLAVAEDDTGETLYEVFDVAHDFDFVGDDVDFLEVGREPDADALADALRDYRNRLRAERGLAPIVDGGGS